VVWNWKSALLSSTTRATIFLFANATAGWRAAWGAFGAELAYRACAAGFYGRATQVFAGVRPAWAGAAAALILLPGLSHGLEFAVHYLRETPELARSIALSASFTVISTLFHLFAMRRGALVVGVAAAPLADDLRRLPRLIADFLRGPFRWRRCISPTRTTRRRAASAPSTTRCCATRRPTATRSAWSCPGRATAWRT
jgi:hypothetical protein